MIRVLEILGWLFVVAGGLYLPFVRSPELTHSQLLIAYWYFYLPAFVIICCLTILGRKRSWKKKS